MFMIKYTVLTLLRYNNNNTSLFEKVHDEIYFKARNRYIETARPSRYFGKIPGFCGWNLYAMTSYITGSIFGKNFLPF